MSTDPIRLHRAGMDTQGVDGMRLRLLMGTSGVMAKLTVRIGHQSATAYLHRTGALDRVLVAMPSRPPATQSQQRSDL